MLYDGLVYKIRRSLLILIIWKKNSQSLQKDKLQRACIMRQTASMIINSFMVDNVVSSFKCTEVSQVSDWIPAPASICFRRLTPDYQCLWWSLWRSNLWFHFALASDCHSALDITKTCLYNTDPLNPNFCIVKLGFTGVYIIFLISAQKHRLWVLVRTASSRRF